MRRVCEIEPERAQLLGLWRIQLQIPTCQRRVSLITDMLYCFAGIITSSRMLLLSHFFAVPQLAEMDTLSSLERYISYVRMRWRPDRRGDVCRRVVRMFG
jgi:hypothetical protein